MFTDAMLTRMQDLFQETCIQMEGGLLEFNGESNHVHLLVTCPPKLALAALVGKLKGKSAFIIRKEFPKELRGKLWGDHLWSPSYASVTCGGAPLSIIKQYIEDQDRPPTAKGVAISKRKNRETRRNPSAFRENFLR